MLKHSEFSCAELMDYAARGDVASRMVRSARTQDCDEGVCGDFVQMMVEGVDDAGQPMEENILMKIDDGIARVYWYRSSLMLDQLTTDEALEEQKDPEQIAYDRLTALHSSLYAYPPCYGVRPSSSNLTSDLVAMDAIDPDQMDQLASACGESFCFAFVGQKVAPLCPNSAR